MQAREQEEALALLEGQKKRGKGGIKLKVGPCTTGSRPRASCLASLQTCRREDARASWLACCDVMLRQILSNGPVHVAGVLL